jgi:hypothetical protein
MSVITHTGIDDILVIEIDQDDYLTFSFPTKTLY